MDQRDAKYVRNRLSDLAEQLSPRQSLVLDFGENENDSPVEASTKDEIRESIMMGLRDIGFINSRQPLEFENACILLHRDRDCKVGLFLTNRKISKNELVGMPGSSTACLGDCPYVGIAEGEDGVISYYICLGNSLTKPVAINPAFMTDEEVGLIVHLIDYTRHFWKQGSLTPPRVVE